MGLVIVFDILAVAGILFGFVCLLSISYLETKSKININIKFLVSINFYNVMQDGEINQPKLELLYHSWRYVDVSFNLFLPATH